MGNNKRIKKILINKYGCFCMMTGISVQKDSDLSYHHIVKREYGGRTTIENGATLLIEIHQWLHNNIESKDKEMFYLINECLKLYKKCLDLNKTELINEYEEEIMPLFRKELSKNKTIRLEFIKNRK